jgi:pimeloyl-ACP methyl ester carboxylesterase
MPNYALLPLCCLLACSADPDATSTLPDQGVADAAVASQDATAADAAPADDAAIPDQAVPDQAAPDAAVPPDATPDQAVPGPDCVAGEITFTTEDGVTLTADLHPQAGATRGVVLLHMIPPSNTRTNYPAPFIEQLNAQGWTVLNVDRRGAGDSEGVARDAYEGPLGRLDAVAARDALLNVGCGVAPSAVAFIGASNGTTTVIDYTQAAPADARPAAVVLLTGGGYTENQTPIADHRALFEAQPMLFVFSTAERAWSAGFSADAPATWRFNEYADGAHGTRMFGAEPSSITDVVQWLNETVPAAE